jgi:hypothetical protein
MKTMKTMKTTREEYITETFTAMAIADTHYQSETALQTCFAKACQMADLIEAKGVAPWLGRNQDKK